MATAAAGDEQLTPDDAADILEEILDTKNKSYFLGLKLKVAQSEVEAIHKTYTDPSDHLLHIFIAFLKGVEPRPTWRVIVDALRSRAVKLPALAKRVEAAHFPDPTSTRDADAEEDESMQVRDREPQQRLRQKRPREAQVERQQQTIKKPKTKAVVVTPQSAVNRLQDKETLVAGPSPHETTKFFIDMSLLDPQFDSDFTDISDGKTKYDRGGERYKRPCGWQRFALKVKGKYEDDKWLGEPGPRQHSSEGEWPVCYYGTRVKMFQTIAQNGYCGLREVNSKRSQEGNSPRGICCSPFIGVAARYAEKFSYKGHTYQLVFQNRVSVERLNKSHWVWTQPHGEYIRPYAVCVRPVDP